MKKNYEARFPDGQIINIARSGREYACAWRLRFKNAAGQVDTVTGFARTSTLATKALKTESNRPGREVVSGDVIGVFSTDVK